MKTHNIKKRFLTSSFLKVFKLIKKKPYIYLYTIILDFIFLALILLIGRYFGSLITPNIPQLMDFFKSQANLLIVTLVYASVYYLLIIFIYSIVKLSILQLINSIYKKSKFTMKGFGKFYSLNIGLFVIFFSFALITLTILALVLRRDFLKYLILVLLIPFLFFVYSLINIAHTLHIQGVKKGIIKKSFSIAFNKINKYGIFLVWDIILISIYLLFYNLIHLIFRSLVFTNRELLATYSSTYLKAFNIISIIFIYLIVAFNRIYFQERINKNVLQ